MFLTQSSEYTRRERRPSEATWTDLSSQRYSPQSFYSTTDYPSTRRGSTYHVQADPSWSTTYTAVDDSDMLSIETGETSMMKEAGEMDLPNMASAKTSKKSSSVLSWLSTASRLLPKWRARLQPRPAPDCSKEHSLLRPSIDFKERTVKRKESSIADTLRRPSFGRLPPLRSSKASGYRWHFDKIRRSRAMNTEICWLDSRAHFRLGKGYSLFPVDMLEADRYQLHHYIMKHVFDGNVPTRYPIQPVRILDVGTGTGIWALEMAQEFPDAHVHGCDIASIIDPTYLLDNLSWDHADLATGLPYDDEQFDLIHQRQLSMYICEYQWPMMARELYRICRPGGQVYLVELDSLATMLSEVSANAMNCAQETLDAVMLIEQLLLFTMKKAGIDGECIAYLDDLLALSGFSNVHHQVIDIPRGDWADQLGRCMHNYTRMALQSSISAVSASTGIPSAEYEAMIERALPALNFPHATHRLHVYVAEKSRR